MRPPYWQRVRAATILGLYPISPVDPVDGGAVRARA